MLIKHTLQFWVGKFDSQKGFSEFFEEDPEYWSEENEDNDDFPLSKFIASQNETRYDHDFIEGGFNESEDKINEMLKDYSNSDQSSVGVVEKAHTLGIKEINAFIMMGIEESPGGDRYLQVSKPCSHKSKGIDLVYVGEFFYTYEFN